jgi:hypothetical protein
MSKVNSRDGRLLSGATAVSAWSGAGRSPARY